MKKSTKRKFAEFINLIPTEITEKLEECTVTTKAVLGSLISLSIQQNTAEQGYFFASHMAIGDMLDIDSPSIGKSLAVLQQKNIITLVERGGIINGKRVANRWNFTFDVKCDEQQKIISIEEYNHLVGRIDELSRRLDAISCVKTLLDTKLVEINYTSEIEAMKLRISALECVVKALMNGEISLPPSLTKNANEPK